MLHIYIYIIIIYFSQLLFKIFVWYSKIWFRCNRFWNSEFVLLKHTSVFALKSKKKGNGCGLFACLVLLLKIVISIVVLLFEKIYLFFIFVLLFESCFWLFSICGFYFLKNNSCFPCLSYFLKNNRCFPFFVLRFGKSKNPLYQLARLANQLLTSY